MKTKQPKRVYKGLSLEPKTIDKNAWFYHDKRGIDLIIYADRETGRGGKWPITLRITWKKVLAAAEDYKRVHTLLPKKKTKVNK